LYEVVSSVDTVSHSSHYKIVMYLQQMFSWVVFDDMVATLLRLAGRRHTL